MIESEIDNLELEIDKLISLLKQAKLESNSLRKKNTSLSHENIALLDKNKKAAGSLKNLIMQLQDGLC
ncbi:MAG: hypothetical protein KKE11_02125 [Gammaproteobacteria bacterium]|nr:hypothetical protein [Gammaproteobacteria bacterium]